METGRAIAKFRQGNAAEDYCEPWKLNVLVVDDEPADRLWISRLLRDSDEFDSVVIEASSLGEASELLGVHDFHVALIDYHLLEDMGDAVVRTVERKKPSCATVLVSSYAMSEVTLFGLRAGANAAVSKAVIDTELLETTIRFALYNRKRVRSAGGANPA